MSSVSMADEKRLLENNPAASRWPPQIKFIIGNEACERFSYYGIRSILALYISRVLFQYLPEGEAKDKATEIIHLFIFANYFAALLGGWLSDKVLGRYYTILYVSLVYCLGNLMLALSVGSAWGLYAGLGLIALGSGGIKPCVSAFCGDQFKPDQSALLQKAFGLFYWSINFGSFFSFFTIPWLREKWGYRVAFGVPGLLMLIATVIFWLGRKQYARVPASRDPNWLSKTLATVGGAAGLGGLMFLVVRVRQQMVAGGVLSAGWATAAAWLAVATAILALGVFATVRLHRKLGSLREKEAGGFMIISWYELTSLFTRRSDQKFWDVAREKFTGVSVDAAATVPPILAVFAPICIFWALFDQTSSTWVMQGESMVAAAVDFTLWGIHIAFTIGPEQMQSMNPAIVMVLVPLTLWFYPRVEKLLGIRVTPLRRMSTGMVLASLAYVVVAFLQTKIDSGAKLSLLWQTLPYLVLTAAEVLISTTGLEFAFTQAAREMKSTITSFWLVTVAIGNLFVPIITKIQSAILHAKPGEGGSASVNSSTFYLYAGLTFFVAIVFMLIATQYKERKLELTSVG